MDKKMDFSAIATKYNVKCSDGKTIQQGSFAHQDGTTVPMVYQHNHSDINNVIGHCLLKEEPTGVRLYAYLNPDVEAGKKAKSLVQHGDIKAVSIYANGLKTDSTKSIVKHGNIKEVSIVLSPANPEAIIDYVALEHSDGSLEFSDEEATIFNGDNIDEVNHSDEEENNLEHANKTEDKSDTKKSDEKENNLEHANKTEDKSETNKSDSKEDSKNDKAPDLSKVELSEKENQLLVAMIYEMFENKKPSEETKNKLKDDYEKLSQEKKDYFAFIIGSYDEDKNKNSKETKGGKEMGTVRHDVFDENQTKALSHGEIKEIFKDAEKLGSLKESVLAHTAEYGVDGIENLFPDYKSVGQPEVIKRDDTFVDVVLNDVTKKPFAKIKSSAFNITATEARAKGYVKGNRKVEEVITALKRETNPQTVYKKQKLDRDDIADITDFDIVAFLKQELKDMLKEEVARAVLVGDGRLPDSPDKIRETNIRPIVSDDEAYSIRATVTIANNATNKDIADEIIEKVLRARKSYKGSGAPKFFCNPDYLTSMLLAKDTIGRRIYNNETELADQLRVSKIVETSVMENATYTDPTTSKVYDVIGVVVNLKDYTMGSNDLGKTAMFDDFDINYNQMTYLIETRTSGALTKPYSAIVVLKEQTNSAG